MEEIWEEHAEADKARRKIMSNMKIKLQKFLPLVIGFVVLTLATNVYAGTKDWIVDKASEMAAMAMGIDTTDNCIPPQAHSSCMFCPLFKVLFNAGNYVAKTSYSAFSSDLGKLVAIFLAVSLAIIVLKNLASMSSKDPGTIINDIFKKAFVCIVIFLIITRNYHNVLNLTLVPIIQTGLSFTNMVDPTNICAEAAGLGGFSESISSGGNSGLPSSIGTMFLCAAQNIEAKINLLFENGRWAFCLGTGPHRIFHILPHPVYIIDGIFLYLGGIFFQVAYPWVLGDAILQMGIAMALLPFAIAGYAFSGTKSYLPKVFAWILHSLFVFIFMAILMTCILTYIANLLTAATSVVDPKVLFTDPISGIAFFGANMVMLIFVLVIGWSYMPMTKDLAGTFSEGSGVSATQKFGTQLTDEIEKQADKVVDRATDVAIDTTKNIANSAILRTRAIGRRSMSGITNRFGSANSFGGNTLNFGAVKYSTMSDTNGQQTLVREWTNPIKKRKHTMLSDKYVTVKQEVDEHGRLIKSQVEFKKDFLKKHLIRADGSVNMDAYNALMRSPIAQQPEMRKAIMASMAEQRLKALGVDVGTHYRSRTITIDPTNPNKILVEQIDNTGKKITFSMEINDQTGQMAVKCKRQRDRNRIENAVHTLNLTRKTLGRKTNISLVNGVINTFSLGRGTVNLGLLKYEVKTDTLGNKYYERTSRKYWLFGAKKVKTYEIDGVSHSQRTRAGTIYSPKKTTDNSFSEDYEILFDNGVITTTTIGVRDPNTGQTRGEVTRTKVSEAAQKGHDSIKSQFDNNQVVDSTGGISPYLGATTFGDPRSPNRYNLEFGMDDFLGQTDVNGHSIRDFVVNDIMAEGRRRKATKFETRFGGSIL